MATNLKKKLIRENPVIARLQDPKYLKVNFLRGVNNYTSWRYPTERQLEVATRIMDDIDSGENIKPLPNLDRQTLRGKVLSIRRVPRNKAYYTVLTFRVKNDPHTYIITRTRALDKVTVGQTITATATLAPSSIPGGYHLLRPTNTGIIK